MTCSFVSCVKLRLSGLFFVQLVDASTLKREVAEGVDLMVVRELTGGQFNQLIKTDLNYCLSCSVVGRFLYNVMSHGNRYLFWRAKGNKDQ